MGSFMICKATRGLIGVLHILVLLFILAGCQNKRNLTKENINSIIPARMTESNVYAVLGINAVVSHDNLGRKYLIYLFPYSTPPPGVNPKVDGVELLISNGVVVRTWIPR